MAIEWDDVVAFATGLPKVEESTSYATPALKAAGKLIARLRTESDGGLMVMCSLEEKEALLASGHGAFYTTPHYDGHASVIVDLEKVDAAELEEMIFEAWRATVSKTVRKKYDDTH